MANTGYNKERKRGVRGGMGTQSEPDRGLQAGIRINLTRVQDRNTRDGH